MTYGTTQIMPKSNIEKSLEQLKESDIYSLLLFALFKLKDDPQLSTLSELVYIVDKNSLFNLLNYYGGMTITIPTMYDLKKAIYALILYQQVNLGGRDLTNSVRNLKNDEVTESELLETYYALCKVLKDYDFRR